MNVGRLLIGSGVLLVAVGLLVTFGERLPFRLGRLPGDIFLRGKKGTFYFPLATCLILSIVLTFLLRLFRR